VHRRRGFLKAAGAGAAVLAAPWMLRAAGKTAEPPNVLLLFSDQHNADVMGCAGHVTVRTPHLDQLASEGVRFARAYCPDGICVPSRTAMFTGLYPRTTGVLYNADAPPEPNGLFPLHRLLRSCGYRTGVFGKKHLPRGLREDGWDASATTISPRLDPSDENYGDWIREKGQFDSHERDFKGSHSASLMSHLSRTSPANRTTAYAASKAIDFLRRCKRESQPFFCWCSFIYPHQPYTPLPQWLSLIHISEPTRPY